MPAVPHPEPERFVALLDRVDLPGRYYGLVERAQSGEFLATDTKAQQQAALEELGLAGRYLSSERFFRHEVCDGELCWRLHLGFHKGAPPGRWGQGRPSTLELGLYLETPRGLLGGPVAALARQVAARRDPAFCPRPGFPRLPYSNEEERREAVRFAADLLRDVRAAALQEGGW